MIFQGEKMKKNAFLLFLLLACTVGPSLAADYNALYTFT